MTSTHDSRVCSPDTYDMRARFAGVSVWTSVSTFETGSAIGEAAAIVDGAAIGQAAAIFGGGPPATACAIEPRSRGYSKGWAFWRGATCKAGTKPGEAPGDAGRGRPPPLDRRDGGGGTEGTSLSGATGDIPIEALHVAIASAARNTSARSPVSRAGTETAARAAARCSG